MLTKRAEEVLQTVHFYRYITAQDVAYALFSPTSLTYVREMLYELCGRGDFQPNQYLYRFPLPQYTGGRPTSVYTLGTLGRKLLMQEMGIPVDWYFKPAKVRHLSFGFVIHALTLTRFLVAASHFVKLHPEFKITRLFTSYELEKASLKNKNMVIPDAWILFQTKKERIPVMLEIDRGSEQKERFKKHIKARIEFIQSGAYSKVFDEEAVLIAYATSGQIPEYRESRRSVMCKWIMELLKELKMSDWSHIFHFTSLDWSGLYEAHLFESPVWFLPDKTRPVTLIL